jgi:type IV pilus assembly protein PilO
VTLTDRDRKIMIALVPVLVLVAYWFLLLAPKRDEASKAGDDVAAQEQRLDVARDKLQTARTAKESFKASYAQVVRLGKAIPSTVDMPSLLVQLNAAAKGTGIRFTHIKTGERTAAAVATTGTTTPPAGSESGTTGTPAAAGGETAQSQPGQAAESANNAQQTADQRNAAAEKSGVSPADTQTSTTASATDPSTGTAPAPAGLETVPLELEFQGDFFHLAEFFHRVKRFVALGNRNVLVSGRLITVEGINWTSDELLFPKLRASIKATVYLSPKSEGVTAGASPTGPSTTTPPDGTTPASSPTPTATATP